MKVVMIGSATCSLCKEALPTVKDYCYRNNIEFNYIDQKDLGSEERYYLSKQRVTKLPVFIIQDIEVGKYCLSDVDIIEELDRRRK